VEVSLKTTLPLPLALTFALWTVLALFTGFAGFLNLLDPSANLIRGHVFLGIAGAALGFVVGSLLGRKEAPALGLVFQVAMIGVGAGYYLPQANPFGMVLIAAGAWGLLSLLRYGRTVLA
jgi:hypothetical protein